MVCEEVQIRAVVFGVSCISARHGGVVVSSPTYLTIQQAVLCVDSVIGRGRVTVGAQVAVAVDRAIAVQAEVGHVGCV